ncbi:hypothetical protein E4N71_00775 [Treponema vincentii]|uniref:hypothetical protein n=1 Tax=Treponema vincentii TaxID=69710 RepID=UPI0005716E45|nr:hypothetical protein [Treponema vincentii]UTC48627.1 hypothetical protein E4N73_07150 [Treponema vincentii]
MTADKQSFLFQYHPKNTCIHRLPAGIKFCVLCISSFVLYGASPLPAAVYAIFLVFVCIGAKLSWVTVKKNCRFLCIYTVCIFCIKIIGMPLTAEVLKATAVETLTFMQKLTLILFTASIFYETTSKLEFFMLCEKIERFFCRKKYTGAFSTLFTITLMCVPRVFEVWGQLNYAYDARTHRRRDIVNAYRRFTSLFPALIENLLRFAVTVDKALKNRS